MQLYWMQGRIFSCSWAFLSLVDDGLNDSHDYSMTGSATIYKLIVECKMLYLQILYNK